MTGMQEQRRFDYGGEQSIRILRDVIRFASGLIPDKDGRYLLGIITRHAADQ